MRNRRPKSPGQNDGGKRGYAWHDRAARRLAIIREENRLRADIQKIRQRHISDRAVGNAYLELLIVTDKSNGTF